jgi:hypothetical protein
MTLSERVQDVAARLRLREPKSRLDPWTEKQLLELKTHYTEVPEDYLLYLKLVGSGSIGDSRFVVYGGFLEPNEVYGPDALRFSGILLIGDDFAGDCLGYNTRANWELGWISSSQRWDPETKNKAFIDLLRIGS